jgi:hypothetical protein
MEFGDKIGRKMAGEVGGEDFIGRRLREMGFGEIRKSMGVWALP